MPDQQSGSPIVTVIMVPPREFPSNVPTQTSAPRDLFSHTSLTPSLLRALSALLLSLWLSGRKPLFPLLPLSPPLAPSLAGNLSPSPLSVIPHPTPAKAVADMMIHLMTKCIGRPIPLGARGLRAKGMPASCYVGYGAMVGLGALANDWLWIKSDRPASLLFDLSFAQTYLPFCTFEVGETG